MRTTVRRLSARVGVLVARLVATELVQARLRAVSPAPVRWSMPAELTARADATTARELLRRLRTDRGCVGDPPRRHLGCRAALELGRREPDDPAVLAALEETVTAAARPACVRSAGVRALGFAGSDEARRALARMRQVTRRRAEWERRNGDRALGAEIDDALRAASA